MKKLVTVMLLSSLLTGVSFAQEANGKRTREAVRQELKEARHEGTMSTGNEYPLSDNTIQRQKAAHAGAVHAKEGDKPTLDKHDDPSR